ncbi:4-hydroxy-3-methylbut-2-enyl diphosphate reductase [Lachnospiraceae bacterium]|nr:4-hydroxy-3-methylbut-2-enyl diphosphate reductase [Eubacterium sp.]GFI26264.1 4-hydroxy-3-methylbut-2-enyl diphosphate reductase [Lachnospiraceae bacterium]
MQVTLAKSAGFCFGVKRAVDQVYQEAEHSRMPVYTFGPIIHNETVVKDLEEKGVYAIGGIEELKHLPKGIVVIRSHGVSKEIYEKIAAEGFRIVDATCPFVLKIHRFAEDYSKKGYHILIIGNASHPEVEGIKGWSDPAGTTVLQSAEEARNFKLPEGENGRPNVCIVSQTTFNYNKFQELVEIIEKKGYDIIVLNTICNATEERQKEAAEISAKADAMIVIGGSHSSNTQKLFEICKKECENTYYIQTLDDLDPGQFRSIDNVGITAGASTPNNIIEEVQKNVRSKR